MKNIEKNETLDARLPYEQPQLTVMGKVEHLTALLTRRNKDLVTHGNLL